jgi:hypothetical protein
MFPINGVFGNCDPIQSELAENVTLRALRFAHDSPGTRKIGSPVFLGYLVSAWRQCAH